MRFGYNPVTHKLDLLETSVIPPGSVGTLTGDSGGAVSPDGSGNINVVGTDTVQFVGTPGTNTLTVSPRVGGYPITPYVVGPVGFAGYQTIQSAINAANVAGGGIVYIQPGTYTENLTFYNNVQLRGTQAYENTLSTIIIGLHTPPNTGKIAISNVELQSATHIFSSAAAGSCTISILDCTFNVTNGYIFNLPNWTGTGFNINDCGELSTNNGVLNNSGGADFFSNNSQIGAGNANAFIANGDVRLDLTFLDCPATISGGVIFVNVAVFSQTIICSGTATGTFLFSNSFPTGAAFNITSSNPITIENAIITTANNPAIAGTGSVTLINTSFGNSTSLAGTLTVTTASTLVNNQLQLNYSLNGPLIATNGLVSASGNNPITGTGTTIGATTSDLITLPLGATPGVYMFRVDITGFDSTTPAGVAYFLTSGFRTTGAAATEMGLAQTTDDFEDAALVGVTVDIFASSNNAVLQVGGIAGKTINWKAVLTYTFGS
jgi:hypothetical protein